MADTLANSPLTNTPQTNPQPLFLVFVETSWGRLERVTFEILSDARKLATSAKGRVEVVLFCSPEHTQALLSDLTAHVREPIHLIEQAEFAEFYTDSFLRGLSEILQATTPNVLFMAASTNGRDVAPRLAARLGLAYFPHCLLIKCTSDGKMDITRVSHGGRVHVQAQWSILEPSIITMKAGVGDPPAADKSPRVELRIKKYSLGPHVGRVRLKKRLPADPKTLDIREAERLVSGGRGVGGKQNFEVLRALAETMGASLAASRAAVDLGWVEYERQVGQTGKAVTPRLYLAAGISGASHHLMGMRESEKIVAVNVDRHAPIFTVAHFAVLGDLHAVLPKLTERIQREKSDSGKSSELK